MRVAIEGCCHGELSMIYDSLKNQNVELLLICGDFQSIRNPADLKCMAVPEKYKKLGEFTEYYQGIKSAPILTIFIGGNHEASNYLLELSNGGYVAPNIYYLGKNGSIWYKGLKISGMSGIFNEHNFMKPSYETVPFNNSSIRSIYHYRKTDFLALFLMSEHRHDSIIMTHDWPEGIYEYGNTAELLRRKPFFRKDIQTHTLGSVPAMVLLQKLKPKKWYSAHLHVKFTAKVVWSNELEAYSVNGKSAVEENNPKIAQQKINADELDIDLCDLSSEDDEQCDPVAVTKTINGNPDEIELDLDLSDTEEDKSETKHQSSSGPFTFIDKELPPTTTEFVSLDKCLPRRQFLQIDDIEPTSTTHYSVPHPEEQAEIYLDEELVCIKQILKYHHRQIQQLSSPQEVLYLSPDLENELRRDIEAARRKYRELSPEEKRTMFCVRRDSFCRVAGHDEQDVVLHSNPHTQRLFKVFGI
ncbi:unnamed protein product [[Candida] boidinii]|uniref:Unnamed protein product n=1 Tax=Candida boidinii TaxID=5477 RepID=A0A9W6SV88_CANBO|nr:unnamed protein product [[Candida] boidinii]GMG18503.1 unnamed protein product [[Candida] boidinii]